MTAPSRTPLWLLVGCVGLVIAAALALLATFGGAALPERAGPPVEQLAVERTVLAPGTITLTVRNTGPDPVVVAQAAVNDAFVDIEGAGEPVDRLATATLVLRVPWETGQPYLIALLTSTGLVIEHAIPVAVATPAPDGSFFGLMTLLGVYVGVVPVLLGMLVLPVLRRVGPTVVRALLAVTVGLLGFLAVDAVLEGFDLAAAGGAGFGGPLLVLLGAALAFLLLTTIDRIMSGRTGRAEGLRLALLVAIGIGLHNLGEGLAIGSAYAVGELALGTALVVGFALHNTTEGLAIVAPLAHRRPPLPVLAGLGLLAGAPASLGAIIGAAVDNAALAALLLGAGAGAVVQVIVQIAPALREPGGPGEPGRRPVDPVVLGGIAVGVLVMYGTGLLVAA